MRDRIEELFYRDKDIKEKLILSFYKRINLYFLNNVISMIPGSKIIDFSRDIIS